MRTRSFLLGVAATIVTAGIAVVVAQHRDGTASTQSHHPMQMLHSMCDDAATPEGRATKPHVPEHLTKALDLTAAQLSTIEQKVGEACAAIHRLHEDMMNVLTPAQKSKLRELHGGGHGESGLHDWLKRLHGGN